MWRDTALIVVSATLANHLGLIEAIEGVIRHRLPVLNCSKCLSFWMCLVCSICAGEPVLLSVAVSFLAAYAALWLELLCGYIDTLYNKIYEGIYTKEADDTEDTES